MPAKLTKTSIDKAEVREKDWFLWDGELKGFGVKIARSGRKSYVCKYRVGRGRAAPTRRITIGTHGSPWTVDQARVEALKILGSAARGEDPMRERKDETRAITVTQLCDLYLEEGVGTKKASTLATDKGRIERHIKPLLGGKKIGDLKEGDIKKFMEDVARGKTATDIKTGLRGRAIVTGGRGTASRTVGLLGGIYTFAVDRGLVEINPVRGVKRFPDKKGDRFLSEDEFSALGQAMQEAQDRGVSPLAIAIIKLLIFTGARRGEIEELKWMEVDFDNSCLRLSDSKTGQKIIPLNSQAIQVLTSLIRHRDSEYAFPAMRGGGFYSGTPKVWRIIRKAAGLDNVRIHDLRYSFASAAVAGGMSLPMIGALLGYSQPQTTARYAHLGQHPLKDAAESIGRSLSAAIDSRKV